MITTGSHAVDLACMEAARDARLAHTMDARREHEEDLYRPTWLDRIVTRWARERRGNPEWEC